VIHHRVLGGALERVIVRGSGRAIGDAAAVGSGLGSATAAGLDDAVVLLGAGVATG
jgi:hypothetical protein